MVANTSPCHYTSATHLKFKLKILYLFASHSNGITIQLEPSSCVHRLNIRTEFLNDISEYSNCINII